MAEFRLICTSEKCWLCNGLLPRAPNYNLPCQEECTCHPEYYNFAPIAKNIEKALLMAIHLLK